MTKADSVHSTPPLNASASNIIQLSQRRVDRAARPAAPGVHAVDLPLGQVRRQRILQSPEPETETGKNARLRLARREAWWQAERQVDYWKACMEMHHAIACVQRADLPEGNNHPKVDLRTGFPFSRAIEKRSSSCS